MNAMQTAWTNYRKATANDGGKFDRRMFGRFLRMAWINLKAEASRAQAAAATRAMLAASEWAVPTNPNVKQSWAWDFASQTHVPVTVKIEG